jgi:hypothetical protein
MSACGTKRTFLGTLPMSAFGGKADIHLSRLLLDGLTRGITTMHVRSGHDCKRWYLRPMIDYLVD